jgi:hypothetical protein
LLQKPQLKASIRFNATVFGLNGQHLSESITQLTDEKKVCLGKIPAASVNCIKTSNWCERIKDTASQLNTGHRSEFYMEQNEMFMVLPRIIFYVLYGIVYILFCLTLFTVRR